MTTLLYIFAGLVFLGAGVTLMALMRSAATQDPESEHYKAYLRGDELDPRD